MADGLLTVKEMKVAWLEAEQFMGFLTGLRVETMTCEHFDAEERVHAKFVAKAQHDKNIKTFLKVVDGAALTPGEVESAYKSWSDHWGEYTAEATGQVAATQLKAIRDAVK